MTSKERVLRNHSFQPMDRFMIAFCATSGVYARMRKCYGVADNLALMETLHVDFRYPKPQWIGFSLVDADGNGTDYFEIPKKCVGDFWHPIRHPLAEVKSLADVEAYPYRPIPETWDYDQYAGDCKRFDECAVLGGAWSWFLEAGCELVGLDRFFYLMADEPEVAHAVLGKATSFMERTPEVMFEKAGQYIDMCVTGDDYGFQCGPMMGKQMFQQFVRREVRLGVETFRPYGGFPIAPSQHLLEDIPTENIVAM